MEAPREPVSPMTPRVKTISATDDGADTSNSELSSRTHRRRPRRPPVLDSTEGEEGYSAAGAFNKSSRTTDWEKLDGARQDRHNKKTVKRADAMGSWKRIWSINGFLHPWLTDVLGNVFGWWGFRRFMRESPWMIMLAQVLLMAWIGTTCLEPIDAMLGRERFYATIGTYSLGGWGYCESGSRTYGALYSLNLQSSLEVPLFSDAIVLPCLCLILTIGSGTLLFFLVYTLFERYRDYRWTRHKADVLEEAATSGFVPNSQPIRPYIMSRTGTVSNQVDLYIEKSTREESEAEFVRPFWRPWQTVLSITMWIALVWNLVVFFGLEAWMRLTLATAEEGDDLKYWLLGVSSSWVIVAHVYRSYWAYGSVVKASDDEDEGGEVAT